MDTQTVGTAAQAKRQELAERCLRSNSYLALKNISCDYLNGVLILRGCVETYYLKQVAQEVVAGVEGLERIDNQIQVVTSGVPIKS
jgi:osmotically-inducible protein OsmY